MKPRLFTLLSMLSLALLVATTILWIRSYFRLDLYKSGTPIASDGMQHSMSLASLRGVIAYQQTSQHLKPPYDGAYIIGTSLESRPYRGGPDLLWDFRFGGHQLLGFGYIQPAPFSNFGVKIAFPYFFLAFLLALFPAIVILSRLRRLFRLSHILCPTCGYDLRASKSRCPECGTPMGAQVPKRKDQCER